MTRLTLVFATFAILFVAQNALAQQIPGGLPSTAEPGRIEDQLQQLPALPSPENDITPENYTPPSIPKAAYDINFLFKGALLQNTSVVTEKELEGYIEENRNQEITFDRVYTLASLLTQHYRDRGYIMSQVFVPPQDINAGAGQVRLRAVEGFVDQVNFDFDDNIGTLTRNKLRRLAMPITKSRPLHNSVLERQLLLMNDIPGVTAQAVVRASDNTPAAADLTIRVTQKKVSGLVSVDNRGTRFIGPIQIQSAISFNDVFGVPGQLGLQVATTAETDEMVYGQARYTKHLGNNGLKMEITASMGQTEPGHTLAPFEVESENKTAELTLSYPLHRARAENLDIYGTFTYRDLKTDTLGTNLSEDRIRALRLGANWNKADRFKGITTANFQLSQGLKIIGNTEENDNTSRADAAPEFTKFEATVSRDQLISNTNFSLFGAITGQFSENSLYASEEFGVGGEAFGSAYDSSEITGDSGAAARLESRYTLYPEKANWVDRTQFYGFYDVGLTVDADPAAGQKSRRTLSSAGVGLRLATRDDFNLALEVAQPIGRRVSALNNDGGDARAFFKLTKNF